MAAIAMPDNDDTKVDYLRRPNDGNAREYHEKNRQNEKAYEQSLEAKFKKYALSRYTKEFQVWILADWQLI